MGNIDFYKEMFITRIYYDIRYDVIKTLFQFDVVNGNLSFLAYQFFRLAGLREFDIDGRNDERMSFAAKCKEDSYPYSQSSFERCAK